MRTRSELFVARFSWEVCAANTCCGGRCGLGGRSESTCPSFSIHVVLNVLWGDEDEEHEESSEQVQDACHGCKVLRSLTLVEEHPESHADGLQAPRNAKYEEELAIEDLEREIHLILM